MKINNIVIGSIFVLGLSLLSTPAYAEEVSEEAPVVEESPAPEPSPEPTPEAEPEPEYVPPPEAFEGLGGWAEVDPTTGEVLTVVVGNVNSMEDWEGMKTRMANSGKGTVMRFQTRATADGNVAGYSSSGNTEVKFESSQNNFSIKDNDGDYESTLIPEQTARDEAGMDLSTGLVDTKTKQTTEENVEIRQTQEDYLDEEIETDIFFPDWGTDGKLFNYGSELQAKESIESDVDNELVLEGYTVEQEATEEPVVDEENVFVKTVRAWTNGVVEFFASIF